MYLPNTDYQQALVEFYSVDDAIRVKRNLNGADIYSGCCTLKIEYATTNRVNVIQNSEDSIDYETPNMGMRAPHSLLGLPNNSDMPPRGPMLGGRQYDSPSRRDTSFNGSFGGGRETVGYYEEQRDNNRRMVPLNNIVDHSMNYEDDYGHESEMHYNGGGGGGGPRVAMIYGLNLESVNCDGLFNLLCIYGNVIKIKFLKSKEGSAMVQMGDGASIERMMHLLHNQPLFGKTLQFQISKQPVIIDVPTPYKLPDASDSFKDYTNCRENRFVTPELAGKNRVFPPSKTINYWNAPPNFGLELIQAEFKKYGAIDPPEFFQLTNRDKSSSGLLQWNTVEDATNAIALCNHIMINSDGAKFPYQLKLSFSESPIRHGPPRNANNNGNNSNVGKEGGDGPNFHRKPRERVPFNVPNKRGRF